MEWNEFGRAKKRVGWAWDWGRGMLWKILKPRMQERIGELERGGHGFKREERRQFGKEDFLHSAIAPITSTTNPNDEIESTPKKSTQNQILPTEYEFRYTC